MYLEYSLRGLLTAFFRQQAKFYIVFVTVMLLGIAYIASIEPAYQAKGSFLIKFGQNAVPDVNRPSGNNASEYSRNDRDEMIQSHLKILQSSNLLDAAIKDIGVENLYPGLSKAVAGKDTPEQAAVAILQKSDLGAYTDSKSNIIELTINNKDPIVAQRFAMLLLEKFIARQAEVFNAPQTDFLQQQTGGTRTRLEDAQKAFQAFKQEVGISVLDEEMEQLLTEKRDLSGIAFQSVTQAQATLAALENQATEASVTYREDSPVMKRLRESIAAAQEQVQKRQEDLDSAGTDNSVLSSKVSKIDARISFLEANRTQYEDFEQRLKLAEDNYKYYQQRIEEAQANDILNQQNITRISIVDVPAVPVKPLPTKRKLLLLAFLMTALLLGVGTALAAEMVDNRVAYPEQLSSILGLTVLATFNKDEEAGVA